MRTGVCVGVKGDNQIIRLREWVEHYVKLGFDRIFLYDNNDFDGPNPLDCLKGLEHYIEYNDIRGCYDKDRQWKSYTNCYVRHQFDCDWILFVDDDEYLFLYEDKTIQDYLSRECFKDVDCIHINWKLFDSGDLLFEDPDIPLYKQYTHPVSNEVYAYPNIPANSHIKCFLHCNGKPIYFRHPHFACGVNGHLTCVNASGLPARCEYPFTPVDHRIAALHHYQLRTIDIFCYKRLGERSKVMFDHYPFMPAKEIEGYFKYNEHTQERELYVMDYCIKHNIPL